MSKINFRDNNWNGIEINDSKFYPALLNVANIGELKNAPDLLVFPNSLEETSDKLGELPILTVKKATFDDKKKCTSLTISTGNVMGFIGYGNTEIRIHSRFDKTDEDINKDANDFFLYYMLAKVFHVNLFNLDTTSSRKNNILDLLMVMFPQMLKDAMSQGLYKEYRTYQYNDARVRGTIEVNRFIREDIPFQGKVAYRTREFSHDNKILQLVRHTIEYMRHHPWGHGLLNNDLDTRSNVLQIINATPTYSKRDLMKVLNDNRRPVSHPYYTKYRPLQQLCVSILRHDGLQYGEEKDKVHGILFDGAWLWEEYIAYVLKQNDTGNMSFKHYTNKNSHFSLFKDFTQKIVPDYLSDDYDEGKGTATAVGDAKYMNLAGKEILQGEQTYSVYYKTIMYMYRFSSKKGFIFFPMEHDDSAKTIQEFKIAGGMKGTFYKIGMKVPETYKDYVTAEENFRNDVFGKLSINASS